MAKGGIKRSKDIIAKSLKYGLIGNLLFAAGIGVFWFLFENVVMSARNLSVFISLIFMFFAVKEYRADNGNILLFWEGIFVGLATFFVFAVISGFILFLLTYIDPQTLAVYKNFILESSQQYKDILDDKYAEYSERARMMKPFDVSVYHWVTLFYVGIFGSPIVAIFLRKTPRAA